MDEVVEKPRYRVPAGREVVPDETPRADLYSPSPWLNYASRDPNTFLAGFRPILREASDVTASTWEKQAARVIYAYQNSGFVRGVIETSTAQVVGAGLRMSSRPDTEALGWTSEQGTAFARQFEAEFKAWATNPYHCDASAQLNFGQIQQAFYWCSLGYGEGLSLLPFVERPGSKYRTKVKLLPPSRIVNKTNGIDVIQGVRVDNWGMPLAYFLYERHPSGYFVEKEVLARDQDGRPNIIHRFMPAVAVTRSSADLGTGMKAYRQFDQYSDANLTKKMIQTIFAATIKTNLQGLSAFEGLMTPGDSTGVPNALDLNAFGEAKGQWYDGAKIDLSQHGRIGQLFPGDELDFVEAKSNADDFDKIGRWLWLEICSAAGVSYESGTGDYRGATYSSVRMAGAKEWQNVVRRRDGVVVPFCQAAAEAVLEEAIGVGRIKIPGGLKTFLENRSQVARCIWNGPRQPQADDFKTARAHQTRKEIGATTLETIFADYGEDWDDAMRQQQKENQLAEELGLPKPWVAPPVPGAVPPDGPAAEPEPDETEPAKGEDA